MSLIILDFEMRYYKGHVKIILSITQVISTFILKINNILIAYIKKINKDYIFQLINISLYNYTSISDIVIMRGLSCL
ncbi:hypothetical protein J2127_000493 [Methanococcus voltae]|nr:hypothetical protein [Methanococcus voltae]